MSTDRKTSNISIIIPALNEAGSIGNVLAELREIPGIELFVVDGGSNDNTVELAKSLGVRVLSAPAGKANQMNAGAQAAQGDILLFLHSDTKLVPGFESQVRKALARPGVSAGAFALSIDARGFDLRMIEWLVNLRSRVMQMPYGDQGIFVTADMFFAVGGFPSQPIMEDFELVRKLKKRGRIAILPLRASTSARRWRKLGVLRTTYINQAIIIRYLLGANPEKLADWYRRSG